MTNFKLVFVKLVVFLLVTIPTSIISIAAPNYNPPSTGRQDEESVSSGSRGCDNSKLATFQLIVPKDHVGRTIKSHPTFMWYLHGKADVPMQFILQDSKAHKLIFKTRIKSSYPGIVTLKLPSSNPGLKYGIKYNWTVSLVCSERHPSRNSYASADIERIKIDNIPVPPQEMQLSVYAKLGLWYDAIAAGCTRIESGNCLISRDFNSLLAQVGLTDILALEVQRLRRIVSTDHKPKK